MVDTWVVFNFYFFPIFLIFVNLYVYLLHYQFLNLWVISTFTVKGGLTGPLKYITVNFNVAPTKSHGRFYISRGMSDREWLISIFETWFMFSLMDSQDFSFIIFRLTPPLSYECFVNYVFPKRVEVRLTPESVPWHITLIHRFLDFLSDKNIDLLVVFLYPRSLTLPLEHNLFL